MKTILKLVLVFLSFSLFGQEWAPVDAVWYYDITYAFSGNIDYHRLYCDSIVDIKGIDCKKINIDYRACNNYFYEKLYTYEQNDTIFFYNADIDTFQILYDFNANTGDEWIINTTDDNISQKIILHVDSVSTIDINSYKLPILFVTYHYFYDVGFGFESGTEIKSTVIKNIGDIYFLINIISPEDGACDVDYISNLRCYQDSDIGFYSTMSRDSCTYSYIWTPTQSISESIISLYPNPVNDILNLSIDKGIQFNYQLFDINGQLIKIGNDSKLDLRSCENGLYFIKLFIEDNYSSTHKILKH